MRGHEVQVRGRNQSELQNLVSKRKMLSEASVSLPGPATLEGRVVGSQCRTKELNFGKTNPVGYKRRSPLNFKSNWIDHVYGNKRELGNSDRVEKSLMVEVNREGKRRVVWKNGGLRSSLSVIRDQREHVPSSWVHNLHMVGSDQDGNLVGFPVLSGLEPTGPMRLQVGVSPTGEDPKLLTQEVHAPVRSNASHVLLEA